jgi:hypothetical protein
MLLLYLQFIAIVSLNYFTYSFLDNIFIQD